MREWLSLDEPMLCIADVQYVLERLSSLTEPMKGVNYLL